MSRNYGNVSGWLDPSGRAWEAPIYQTNKPVLDKELNLENDLSSGGTQSALRVVMPSGWLDPQFLDSSQASTNWLASTVPNEVRFAGTMLAHVNGWTIPVANTLSTDGSNRVSMGAAPVGAGAQRTDLVVLEVWRRLISASSISTDGHSPSGRIWWNGNVKIDPTQDLVLNFVDDIEDAMLAAESTKRVQVQYRVRVIQGVDLSTYPYGLDDPSVVARSVPLVPATPDGTATAFVYTNQASNGDSGLWRAGDGNPANTLGTVDGYMYAIPLAAVFRRNSTAFARNTNQNGGVASPGPSDRPDGYFYDILVERDIFDLRMGVSPSGWNFAEVLEKNLNLLLDNGAKTEWVSLTNGGGSRGHTVMNADEIGISNANGGDGIVTGDTPGGNLIGQFDQTRRAFSDRVVYETVVIEIPAPGGPGWVAGTPYTISPTSFRVWPYAAFNWSAYNAAGVQFSDVTEMWWIGMSPGLRTHEALQHVASITGLMTIPITSVSITFATVPVGLTTESLFVTLLVAYPYGQGLTMTPVDDFGTNTFTVNNPGQLPADFSAFHAGNHLDYPHREAWIQYTTTSVVQFLMAQSAIPPANSFLLPERALSITSVLKNAVPIVGSVTLDTAKRRATFTNPADFTTFGDTLTVTYTALRPMPQNDEQMTLYYEARAPQTARGSIIGTTLTLAPKCIGKEVHLLTVGSGSQDEAYPFSTGYTQMGGVFPSTTGSFAGDYELDSRASVVTTGFSASTGYLRLPALIGYTPNADEVTFTRGVGDTDAEGRTFFPSVPVGYLPNAFGASLSDPLRHRNFVGMVGVLPTTTPLGFPGEVVLVVVLREAFADMINGPSFNPDLTVSTTSAAVFRVKGNLLNARS